jgi:anthranilate synthase/aminodeoxychorismate synthase-like glutamine amidotransferase
MKPERAFKIESVNKSFCSGFIESIQDIAMILVIDNYDSFTFNLVQYLGELGQCLKVFRNDAITVSEVEELNPTHILISPGPSTPDTARVSNDIISELRGKYPILGVCLGHQCIGENFGGKVTRAPYLMHGKVSKISFQEGEPLFKGLKQLFTATRYHSLIIDRASLEGKPLEVTAWTSDDLVMGVRHKEYSNLVGVQFHPESILTEYGHQLLMNFLAMKGL